jgi:nucleoside-diphosphate-sugar epimerase
MQIFLTGANGFIGGAVAAALIAAGHKVRGLVRNKAKASAVAAHDVQAVVGSLDDAALLQAEAHAADAVVNAASSDHRGAVEALIAGLTGSGKPLLHTSGSSIVADLAMGEPSDQIFHEGRPIEPEPAKAARVAIDRLVLDAPGIRSVVLCNTMIYGNSLGPPAQSVQIPALVRQAKASGVARYVGRGLNRWSNVHVADVTALYALALTKAPAGTFMYVESGEETLREIASAIAARLGLRAAQSWSAEEAIASWGRKHGGVLAGLEQPRARQGWRRSRLVAHTAVGHALDHQRARLKAGPRKPIRRGEATGEPTRARCSDAHRNQVDSGIPP